MVRFGFLGDQSNPVAAWDVLLELGWLRSLGVDLKVLAQPGYLGTCASSVVPVPWVVLPCFLRVVWCFGIWVGGYTAFWLCARLLSRAYTHLPSRGLVFWHLGGWVHRCLVVCSPAV